MERQKYISFDCEGLWFENAFRVDIIVDGAVIIEVESVASLAPVHEKQVLTYPRLPDCRVGLLLNFGAATMKEGFRRVANRL